MQNAVIVAGQRTPFGAFGGTLKDISATELTVLSAKATLEKAQLKPEQIDHVVYGNVVQSGADAAYLARHVGLKVGVPVHVPAFIVNRLCGSGFQSWVNAAQMIQSQEATCVLAGGVEQMSQIPFVIRNVRFSGLRMGPGELEDSMTAALTDAYAGIPMAITAENLGEKYSITRDQVDEYSYLSQQRCKTAVAEGVFSAEMTAVQVPGKKPGAEILFQKDEHPKPDVALEKIKSMKPLFKPGGLVTAATASGIVDGAASTILMSTEKVKQLNVKPLAKIVSYASVGCDPKIMGIGPVGAIKKALQHANLSLAQMDLIEVNEAFAAQYLAVEKELGLERSRTNISGGAIAIGHPLGASGTRIMNHLVHQLHQKNLKYAVGSACIGGGQGIAIVIERL